MKILVYLHHPSQFYLFRKSINIFLQTNNECIVFATKKDILTKLLDSEGIPYVNNLPEGRKNNRFAMASSIIKQDFGLLKYCIHNRPDIMIGTSAEICHIGHLLGIPSFMFTEDDASVIPLVAKIAYPFAKRIISPVVTDAGKWEYKKIGYEGYQKLAYLHPNVFDPQIDLIKDSLNINEPYYIIRLSKLSAHHDRGISGFDPATINTLIQLLTQNGNVYISSEFELPHYLKKYQLELDIKDIHHALYFSDLYIGDSQSMAVEAALLGTPGIRFSDFTGRISVLEELEHKYNLTFGFNTKQKKELINKVKELLQEPDIRNKFRNRRSIMLSDKIDVTKFIVWFVKNYPDSLFTMENNSDYHLEFK